MAESDTLNKNASLPQGKDNMDSSKDATTQEEAVSTQPKRTLFVRSLPASATTESLTEHFSQSYVIKHAVAVSDRETKQSKGYGFVTFADVEDAKAALEELNGSTLDGKKIRVDYAQPRDRTISETDGKSAPSSAALELKKQREDQRAGAQPPKLIVRNLPWSIKEADDLAVHFRSFGKIKWVNLPKKGGKLAGFGFVVLRGKKNAEKALQAVNGKEVDGRTLAVDWAVEKEVWEETQKDDEDAAEKDGDVEMADGDKEDEADSDEESAGEEEDSDDDDEGDLDDLESLNEIKEGGGDEEEQEDERNASTIFLRNLPFTCTDESLYEHFSQFGPLRYARIVVDHETERPRGTGFVCFWKTEDSAACVRDAPKQQDPAAAEKEKGKKPGSALKHSVLQNENADPSGLYTMDGRVLQVSRAVSKTRANQLEDEGASRRFARDTDKRRLYLLSEGTMSGDAARSQKLPPSEIKMREDSSKQRQNLIKRNPSLHLSLTRLSVRNLPRHITSKDLKQLARQAIPGFAQDAKAGLRQALSKAELQRHAEEMKAAETLRKKKGLGVVRQAKIVYEGRDGSKIAEGSGAGRSRGYGFVEYYTHRHALMGLRWLNGHAVDVPANGAEDTKDKKKRLIVEFAIENANVVKRRNEMQERSRAPKKGEQDGDDKPNRKDSRNRGPSGQKPSGQKRKRAGNGGNGEDNDGKDDEEQNKIAKRNRIISKKRMQRRSRKGGK